MLDARACIWYVMDEDKEVIHNLAHPPASIFYLPVNKDGQVSYLDELQPHDFYVYKTIMHYIFVYKCTTRHKSMQESTHMHSFIVSPCFVHVDNIYQTSMLKMYIIYIPYLLQS